MFKRFRIMKQCFLLLAILLYGVCIAEEYRFENVKRVVAVGDIHGAFDEFTTIMQQAELIDAELNWIGGKTHFVSVGDLTDRGPGSYEILDLFIKLEQQAEKAGGRVHVVLGNHEVMNLNEDLRYVPASEYSTFAALEPEQKRQQVWQQYRLRFPDLDETQLINQFNQKFPMGYFYRQELFLPSGKYGQWLFNKPTVIVINDVAFVHGGLGPYFKIEGLEQLNEGSSEAIKRYAQLWELVKSLGVAGPEQRHVKREMAAQNRVKQATENSELLTEFVTVSQSPYLNSEGPLWYRGNALCIPEYEQFYLQYQLQVIGAQQLVIGHTPTNSREVEVYQAGKAIAIDTGMLKSYYQGNARLLQLKKKRFSVFDGNQWQQLSLQQEYAHSYQGKTYEDWLEFLQKAELIARKTLSDGVTRSEKLLLEYNGLQHSAIFKTEDQIHHTSDNNGYHNTDRYQYELAAFKLAQMLDIGNVPPTILRKIGGKEGSLQLWIDDAFNETQRQENQWSPIESCQINYQDNMMDLFDKLTFNSDRTLANILYTKPDWRLWMIDHSRAFRTKGKLPKYLEQTELTYSPEMVKRLKSLNYDILRKNLKGLLSREQIRSLLKRRDQIIESWRN